MSNLNNCFKTHTSHIVCRENNSADESRKKEIDKRNFLVMEWTSFLAFIGGLRNNL